MCTKAEDTTSCTIEVTGYRSTVFIVKVAEIPDR
jgi:hypothetical protein